MHSRYAKQPVAEIFSDMSKLLGWQETDLAVLDARVDLGEVSPADFETIRDSLHKNPPDIAWWKAKDKEVNHDLNAFLEERRRFLLEHLRALFHKGQTSYDTEEPAFARALRKATLLVMNELQAFHESLTALAEAHRFTLLLDRSHGQYGKLRTFGSRVLSWKAELRDPTEDLPIAYERCGRSRISGAMGNYGVELSPEIERLALSKLGLRPFKNATQITPRTVYAKLAQTLELISGGLTKISLDIRLGARSGFTIYREPFGKKQKGSSAMPHKKNPISAEQMEGMDRLVRGYVGAIVENCKTWEARAIEQSCVERVAWPDLFDAILHMLQAMNKVIRGLVVFPDVMLREIIDSRTTYASDEAKDFLADKLSQRGFEAEDAYRIVQLAAFLAFRPNNEWLGIRVQRPMSLEDAGQMLERAEKLPQTFVSMKSIIDRGFLSPEESLDANDANVNRWNQGLQDLFSNPYVLGEWDNLFKPSHLLKYEHTLYEA